MRRYQENYSKKKKTWFYTDFPIDKSFQRCSNLPTPGIIVGSQIMMEEEAKGIRHC